MKAVQIVFTIRRAVGPKKLKTTDLKGQKLKDREV